MTVDIDARADVAYRDGLAVHRQGQLEEAQRRYAAALELQPNHARALHMAGLVALASQQPERAVELIHRAVLADPQNAAAYNHLGNALLELRHWQAAIACYDRAIALEPGVADVHYNRANALLDMNQYAAAVASYDAALVCDPHFVLAHNNRGLALGGARQYREAIASYERALALDPGNVGAHHFRGNALQDLRQYEAAIASYGRAIELDAGYADAYYARGNAHAQLQRYEAALADYDQALSLRPNHEFLFGLRLHLKMLICDWRGFDAELAELTARIERSEPACMPFPMLALADSASLQRKTAEIWTERRGPSNAALPGIVRSSGHRKIRLAYVSADFRDHPVCRLTAELFEKHDRSRFELTALSIGPGTSDALRTRVEAAFDHFIDVGDISDQDIALLARRMEIDIAVDLGGFTQEARPGIFALRAAPLQVGYLGYPGTTAAGYMDYLIADPTIIPPHSRHHYAEKIIYLPDSYQPNDSTRGIAAGDFSRREFGLPERAFVFCCFNNSFKITPATFDRWMRILERVDGSVLWLSEVNPSACRNLHEEAARRGVNPQRLVFAKRLPLLSEHLARHRLADLFLDTLPFNAHATASDALWAGLPVLTCQGESFAARVASSLLNAVRLPELVASDPAEYENLAVSLAADPSRLTGIRRRLAENRLEAPLFDTERLTRHLEEAYTRIYQACRSDIAPEHVYLESCGTS